MTVNEAYEVATEEQIQIVLAAPDKNRDPVTLLGRKTQWYRPKPKKFFWSLWFQRPFQGWSFCRLVWYPPDFQSKRKGPDGSKLDFKPNGHFSKNTDDLTNKGNLTEN